MPYGIVDEVRRLAGLPEDQQVVTDSEIEDMILSADDEVEIKTGKFDWSSQDEGYKTVEEASNFLAAYSVVVAWDPDQLEKAKELRSRGQELIKSLMMGKFTSGNSSVVIGSTSYGTYQLNDELDPFMSTY